MKCQICGKDNATIHIREIRNGEKKSYYICEECAAKNGKSFDLAQIVQNITATLSQMGSPSEKLSHSSSPEKAMSPSGKSKEDLARCPLCGWSMEQLRKTGVLGCPECYNAFRTFLLRILKNVQRGVEHKGLTPMGNPKKENISSRKKKEMDLAREEALLRKELQSAIAREEYEQAALLRDRINALKSSTGKGSHEKK